MATSAPLRWGICGTGRICKDFTTALNALPRESHVVHGVAARNQKDSEAFAAKFGVSNAFATYQDLFGCPDIDVVYIGVINTAHKQCVLAALRAGKNVLCEKPLGISADEAHAMKNEAEKTGCFLMEGYWSRCFPAYRHMLETVQGGKIGDVVLLNANFTMKLHDNVLTLESGGGATLALGYYLITLSSVVFAGKKLEKVETKAVLNKEPVDEAICIRLSYEGGGLAQLFSSITYDGPCDAFIHGTKGAVRLPHPFWCPLEVKSTVSEDRSWPHDPAWGSYPKEYVFPGSSGFRYEAEHVRDCIQKGLKESPLWSLKQTVDTAELTEMILKQINYGKRD